MHIVGMFELSGWTPDGFGAHPSLSLPSGHPEIQCQQILKKWKNGFGKKPGWNASREIIPMTSGGMKFKEGVLEWLGKLHVWAQLFFPEHGKAFYSCHRTIENLSTLGHNTFQEWSTRFEMEFDIIDIYLGAMIKHELKINPWRKTYLWDDDPISNPLNKNMMSTPLNSRIGIAKGFWEAYCMSKNLKFDSRSIGHVDPDVLHSRFKIIYKLLPKDAGLENIPPVVFGSSAEKIAGEIEQKTYNLNCMLENILDDDASSSSSNSKAKLGRGRPQIDLNSEEGKLRIQILNEFRKSGLTRAEFSRDKYPALIKELSPVASKINFKIDIHDARYLTTCCEWDRQRKK